MNKRILKVAVFVGACLLVSTCCTQAFAAGSYKHSDAGNNLGFKGWGPRLGFVDTGGGLDATAEIGVVFDFGEFIPNLKWDGSVSFWSTGRNYRYPINNHTYDWTVRDFIFRTGVNYLFTGGEWIPFLGGGLAAHFYSWDYNNAPYYSNNSDSKVGIYLDGGIQHQFSESWTGQMQLQGDFASPDQTALMFNLIYRIQ